jgi:capsular exopolysaccharide synthesis family protein
MKHEINEEFEKIDLFRVFRKFLPYLRRFWILAVILAIFNGATTFYSLQRSYRPMYKCEAMFSVAINYEGSSDISSYRYNYDKTAAEQVANSFPHILSSDIMNELIRQELGTPYINGSISAAAVPGTNFFQMTVTSGDPEAAYRVLLAAIETYPQVSQHVIGNILLNLVRDPVPPTTPYTTFTWHKQVAVAAFSGAVLGLGIVLAMALMRRTVLSTDELKKVISLSCLARVPNVKVKQRKNSALPSLLISNQLMDPGFCESFRLLRLKLMRRLKEDDKVIMFTSSLPSEGKSSLTVNTALSLAKDGKKVLLIDADLRHPSVKSLLNISKPSTGLGDYLLDGLDAVSFTRYENTKLFLFAGDISLQDPSKLLQHDKLHQLIQSLRPMFDYVILDTPPCGMMADASVFAQHADKVVYVIREDYASPHQICEGVQSISSTGADICGYVFNRTSANHTSRYGYGYGYGRYGYGSRYGYGKKETSSGTISQ